MYKNHNYRERKKHVHKTERRKCIGSKLFPTSSKCSSAHLQIFVVVVGQDSVLSLDHVLFQLSLPFLVHLNFGRCQGRHGNKLEIRIAYQFAGQPKEGLLKVVIGLRTNIVVLQVTRVNNLPQSKILQRWSKQITNKPASSFFGER